jgi:hypothetical protein
VAAEPGVYDAMLLHDYVFDASPLLADPNRLAVAVSLLYHDVVSGELFIDGERSISRPVGIEIERFFMPVDVLVSPQSLTPVAIPSGECTAVLQYSGVSADLDKPRRNGETTVKFMHGGYGAVFSQGEIVIGCNLRDIEHGGDGDDLLRHIGALCFFCGELSIRNIVLANSSVILGQSTKLEKTRRLLNVVGIDLSWPKDPVANFSMDPIEQSDCSPNLYQS